jgi:hypothetical protein
MGIIRLLFSLTAQLFDAMCHFCDGRPDKERWPLKAATEAEQTIK